MKIANNHGRRSTGCCEPSTTPQVASTAGTDTVGNDLGCINKVFQRPDRRSVLQGMLAGVAGGGWIGGSALFGDHRVWAGPRMSPWATGDEIVAIVGGDAMTVTQGVIRRATILIKDGKILRIGQDLPVPEGARVVDATDKVITPGFISLNLSGLGITGGGGRGQNAKLEDTLNPFDNNLRFALGVGITTGCAQLGGGGGGRGRRRSEDRFLGLEADEVMEQLQEDPAELDYGGQPVALCPCCNLPSLIFEPIEETPPTPISTRNHAVIKLSYGHLDGMLVKEDAFYDVVPGSLTGALNQHNWRRQIRQAKEYLQKLAAHERALQNVKEGEEKPKPPEKNTSDELIALVKGEVRLRTRADSVNEIRSMIALAKELGYSLCLDGATESWLATADLAESGAGVVFTPRSRRDAGRGREGQSGSWVETPRVLEEQGIPFAIAPLSASVSLGGLAGRDLTSLPLEAAFAVRGGCSEAKALEALTIVPARLLGLQDRLGSLEVGKDADLLIMDGRPLDYRTYVEVAFVNGHEVYRRDDNPVWPVFPRP